MRTFLTLFTASLLSLTGAVAPAPQVVLYGTPVEGPIVDTFRPPAHFAGPGNRGLTFGPPPGTPVRSSAAGEVTFAGAIGSDHSVSISHADGLRTTYSFLSAVSVGSGDVVAAGELIGFSGDEMHFGVRARKRYLDPAVLLAASIPSQPDRATLVPG